MQKINTSTDRNNEYCVANILKDFFRTSREETLPNENFHRRKISWLKCETSERVYPSIFEPIKT